MEGHFVNLDTIVIKDNIQFWKKINSFFSEKSFFKELFSFMQRDKITDSIDLTETFNKFFNNVKNLNIDDDTDNESFFKYWRPSFAGHRKMQTIPVLYELKDF